MPPTVEILGIVPRARTRLGRCGGLEKVLGDNISTTSVDFNTSFVPAGNNSETPTATGLDTFECSLHAVGEAGRTHIAVAPLRRTSFAWSRSWLPRGQRRGWTADAVASYEPEPGRWTARVRSVKISGHTYYRFQIAVIGPDGHAPTRLSRR